MKPFQDGCVYVCNSLEPDTQHMLSKCQALLLVLLIQSSVDLEPFQN